METQPPLEEESSQLQHKLVEANTSKLDAPCSEKSENLARRSLTQCIDVQISRCYPAAAESMPYGFHEASRFSFQPPRIPWAIQGPLPEKPGNRRNPRSGGLRHARTPKGVELHPNLSAMTALKILGILGVGVRG